MEPENGGLEDDFPFQTGDFHVRKDQTLNPCRFPRKKTPSSSSSSSSSSSFEVIPFVSHHRRKPLKVGENSFFSICPFASIWPILRINRNQYDVLIFTIGLKVIIESSRQLYCIHLHLQ